LRGNSEVFMSIPVLLVSTATRWYGTARIPRALSLAGFDVALLTPRNSLAEKSGYVGRIAFLEDRSTPMAWMVAFSAMVSAVSPRIVIPCDDMAFRLLGMLATDPPQNLRPDAHLGLAALIRDSLGEPALFDASVNKTRLPAAIEPLGVRMPPWVLAETPAEGRDFAARHGYPIVVKRNYSFAGNGVAICRDQAAVERAFVELRRPDGIAPTTVGPLLLQAHIDGPTAYYPMATWRGELLAGWCAERLVGNPEPKGPATVVRNFRSDEIRGFATAVARAFAMSGLSSLECTLERDTGKAYLIEINRRVTPGMHCSTTLNVDFCGALRAAMQGEPLPSRRDLDPGEEISLCRFPGEWLRDPQSKWLRNLPVDVPWEEPDLVAALLALRHENSL
jgi:hypothetical protein